MTDPLPEPRGACLASYRINMTSRVWPFIVPAAILISLGALGVCMAFVTHGPFHPYANVITMAGASCMLAGLILTLFAARPVLAHDEYVAALERGLLLKLDGDEQFLAWTSIAGVSWDGERAGVIIRMRDRDPLVVVRTFGTVTGDVVAAKLDDVRRKSDFMLL